ncbi:MAG: extracellular solute-binding protein [Clostridiaceae bacterium]|nr:extracellular solute-binding protein [Clostridiaceae bacterium]
MKRKISVLLAVCLLLTFLVSCASDGSSTTTAATTTSAATTAASTAAATTTPATSAVNVAAVSLENTEIVYNGSSPVFKDLTTISWLCTNGSSLTFDWEKMDWCQEICRRANVELDMELLDSSVYEDVVKPRLAAGVDLPDVVGVPGKDQDMSYIDSGIFAELTDYYGKEAYNLNWRFETNPTLKSQLTTPDGRIYYVPVINMSTDYCPAVLINFDWMDQLGKTVPTTTEELYDLLAAMKGVDFNGNGEKDEWPLFLRANMEVYMGGMWGLDLSLGYLKNDDGSVETSYTTDEYYDYLTYMNRLYTEGLLHNEWSTSTYDIQNKLFSNNVVGAGCHYTNNCQAYCYLINPDWNADTDRLIIGAVEPMTGPYGDKFYLGLDPLAGLFAITRDCVNPEAVFCFLDYLYSEEANKLLYYGIEGVDYTVENGKLVIDTVRRETDNYAAVAGNNMGGFPRILLGEHRDNAYVAEIGERNAAIKPYYRIPIGSMFATPDQLDTMQAYATDLSTYWTEMRVAFITGSNPLSGFDDYVQTLESMHIDDMAAVYADFAKRLG